MTTLRIAIDCDDVLFLGAERMIQMYNRLYGTKVSLQRAYSSNNEEWGVDRDETVRRLAEIQESKEYNRLTPIVGSVEVIRNMSDRHELYLVTARHESLHNTTSALIEQYYPNCFRDIYHVGDSSKGAVCSRVQADILIDDNRKHLVDANQYGVGGLLWFGQYPWQDRLVEDSVNVVRCQDWRDVSREIEQLEQD